MYQQAVDFFVSGFVFPGILWYQVLIAIGLSAAFSAIWFTGYWTPVLKKTQGWAVLCASAFLSWLVISFIQVPLQLWIGIGLNSIWGQTVLTSWVYLTSIPQMLVSGIVQEASKLAPVIFLWYRRGRNITPLEGLVLGAVAGLGFGVFEAVIFHNQILASGWSWEYVQSGGLVMLAGFWERFFSIGFHIAASALAGWGLARGKGWQFYLLAAFLHALLNYGVVLYSTGLFTVLLTEIYVAVMAVLLTGAVLWLRWRNSGTGEITDDAG